MADYLTNLEEPSRGYMTVMVSPLRTALRKLLQDLYCVYKGHLKSLVRDLKIYLIFLKRFYSLNREGERAQAEGVEREKEASRH